MSRYEAASSPPGRARSQDTRGLAAGICHRVQNDLQTIANLLFLAAGSCETPEELARAVEVRAACLSAAYALVARTNAPPELAPLVRQVAERCLARSLEQPAKPEIAVPDLILSLRVCSPLSIWLGECIGNAVAHGGVGRGGRLCIDGGLDNGLWVEVRDFGPGLPPGLDLDADAGLGLGLRLAKALAATDLRGAMELTPAQPGVRARLSVPAGELERLNRQSWT